MSEPMQKMPVSLEDRERRQRERGQKQKLWRTLPFLVVGLLVVVGVGLILYGNTLASWNSTGSNGARLEVDRDQIDFGDQHFNATVRASFKITNSGDGTLSLEVPRVATVVEGC